MNEDGLVFKTHEDIELARRIFANDFMMFCAYFFRVMTGEVMKINWHHKLLCKLVEEVVHKRVSNVLVNISPGSSKCACAGEKVFTSHGFIPIEVFQIPQQISCQRQYHHNRNCQCRQSLCFSENKRHLFLLPAHLLRLCLLHNRNRRFPAGRFLVTLCLTRRFFIHHRLCFRSRSFLFLRLCFRL